MYPSHARCYSLKISQDGTVVRDYVPMRRLSDGEAVPFSPDYAVVVGEKPSDCLRHAARGKVLAAFVAELRERAKVEYVDAAQEGGKGK